MTAFLHAYTADLSQGNLHEISQILQALIEMCVGSVENQQVIYDKLVVDPLNRILQLPLDDMHNHCRVDEPQKVRALIAISVVFLLFLIVSFMFIYTGADSSERQCY